MKIAYIANIRLPTEKAHGYQIMRTCAALAAQGAEVTLVVPARRNPLGKTDPFTYYGIAQRFPIVRLPVVDLVGVARRLVGPLGFWIESFTFARAVKTFLRVHAADWVYSRDELILKTLGPIHRMVAAELHALPNAKHYTQLLQRLDCIIVITRAIKEGLEKWGIVAEKIVVASDAVELDEFSRLPEKAAARAQLGWNPQHKIALYAGHPYPWKGVFRLAEASRLLPEPWRVVFVGGQGNYLKPLQNKVMDDPSKRAQVIPHQERNKLPAYYAAADVLVVPNSPETDRSRLYTSPLKLFEYLAAGRPIVASDLPSIREVVSEREVIFVNPSSFQSIADGIRHAGEEDQSARVAAAKKLAERYTWDGRATTILAALNALPKT
ncbi:MAG: glycosyltransferase [bacterium]|nr:glycosyltransferase [bacterium]